MEAGASKTRREQRAAVEPQRRPGIERVATLLEVGAAVIAEKGYEAATMAEIAERSASAIGSLYRFFPSKEVLANALIEQYGKKMDEAFAKLNADADPVETDKTADALIQFLVHWRRETTAIPALLDAHSEWSAKRLQFRHAALAHIAHTLQLLAPALPLETAQSMAVVLLHNMKTMASLNFQEKAAAFPGAIEELRLMNRIYVATRLAPFR